MSGRTPQLVKTGALAACYFGAAKLGLALAFETPSVTAVWPPTGIALAVLVLGGYRYWPGVALGAFFANLTTGDVPLYGVLGITIGNTLEALIGAFLLNRVGFRPSLDRVRDVLALALLAGGVSTAVAATFGTTSLLVGDQIGSGDYGSTWRTWWLGDMGGDLLVAPALMVAVTRWPFRSTAMRTLEALSLVAITAADAVFVFSQDLTVPFLLVPVLIWACLRFGAPGAVGISLLIASIAIPFTEADNGPFAGEPVDERLLLAQSFLGVACVSALVLAALVTQRQRVEQSLQYIATTLQESLLPTGLPQIPGAEIAVDFRPAGERHIVGGDFYDWFENDDGTWSVVIGDVVGKGPTAAATTALARYTLRAAAMNETDPSRILQQLNDALLRQSPGQTCTVALVRIEVNGAGAGRARLSVGGHPPPLVLRSTGEVEEVGRGTMLGVEATPRLVDDEIELASGDALVLYTDGLTDAYAPQRAVSPDQLSAAVGACTERAAGGIIEGIEDSLLQNEHGVFPRDDIVLLVLRLPEHQPTQ